VTLPSLTHCLLVTVTQFEALSPREYAPIWGTPSHLVTTKLSNQQTTPYPLSMLFILNGIYFPLCLHVHTVAFLSKHSVTHDALRTTSPTVLNSTAVRETAAAPECLQPHRKIVATWRRTSVRRCARLCMAAGRPMARQSGFSKYVQGVQTLARNLWFMAATKVHTLPEVTSPQIASEEGCFLKKQKAVLCEHRTLMGR
jgi:hypothetical protein